jgi:hypothetical protein
MGEWKYLRDSTGEYLFNLAKDPSEKNNLKDANPDVFSSLKSKYADWERSVLEPVKL